MGLRFSCVGVGVGRRNGRSRCWVRTPLEKSAARSGEAQDGSNRSKVDVVADNVQFLGGRSDSDDGATSGGGGGQARRGGERGGRREDVDINEEDFEDIPF